jgi:hypothetical protein
VARLAPMHPTGARAPWPDLDGRTRAVFGDRIVRPSASDIMLEGRGDR